MSTKIYDAFKFEGSPSEVLSILKDLKNKYLLALENSLSKLMKDDNMLLRKSDYPCLVNDTKIGSIGVLDLSKVIDEVYHRPQNIHALDLTILPSGAVVYFHLNNIYVQFFNLSRDLMSEVKKDGRFIDFHYQDSTDMSNYDWKEKWNDMSSERKKELKDDWEFRRKTWDEILHPSDTPIDSGLSFEFKPAHSVLLAFRVFERNKSSLEGEKNTLNN